MYQDVVDILCHHHTTAAAAVKRLRARIQQSHRSMTAGARKFAVGVCDDWLAHNADPAALANNVRSAVVVETPDVWQSARQLEGTYLIRRRVVDLGGRAQHVYLPLVSAADLAAATSAKKPGRKQTREKIAA